MTTDDMLRLAVDRADKAYTGMRRILVCSKQNDCNAGEYLAAVKEFTSACSQVFRIKGVIQEAEKLFEGLK